MAVKKPVEKQMSDETTESNKTAEPTCTTGTTGTTCKCQDSESLTEIGFYRCKDNVIYITYLCKKCQKILIKKYQLTEIDGMKFYGP